MTGVQTCALPICVNADMLGHDYTVQGSAAHATPGIYVNSGSDDSRGGDGFFGTIALGYDWQVRDRFVLGAFTDFDFGSSEHSESDSWDDGAGGIASAGWDMERNSTWTIGARFGLLTSNTSMVYGLIGYSRTSLDVTVFHDEVVNPANNRRISEDLDFSGLVLGVGLEQDLGNGFSLKGEYRYTNYGSESFGPNIEIDPTLEEIDHFDLDSHAFRLTLNYKFARGGDMVEEVSYKDVAPAPSYTAPYK